MNFQQVAEEIHVMGTTLVERVKELIQEGNVLNGRFHFRRLLAGAYVLAAGGLQRTVEVGPSLADAKGRAVAAQEAVDS